MAQRPGKILRDVPVRRAAVTVWLALAAYSATAAGEKLAADAEPVRDLGIVVWTAEEAASPDGKKLDWRDEGGRFKDALGRRLPEVFAINGIPVKGVSMGQNVPSKTDPRLQALPNYAATSHLLLLTAKLLVYAKRRTEQVRVPDVLTFDAALWDSRRKRIVWRGSATLSLVRHQPFLQTQDFAGQLLNALQSDGLVTLKQGYAVDGAGEKITEYSPSDSDR
jgi:hypothetical protein